jgi:hypothetical protein
MRILRVNHSSKFLEMYGLKVVSAPHRLVCVMSPCPYYAETRKGFTIGARTSRARHYISLHSWAIKADYKLSYLRKGRFSRFSG